MSSPARFHDGKHCETRAGTGSTGASFFVEASLRMKRLTLGLATLVAIGAWLCLKQQQHDSARPQFVQEGAGPSNPLRHDREDRPLDVVARSASRESSARAVEASGVPKWSVWPQEQSRLAAGNHGEARATESPEAPLDIRVPVTFRNHSNARPLAFEHELPVPRGTRLPAVVIEEATLTDPQSAAADAITDDFIADISEPKTDGDRGALHGEKSRWDSATADADERYRMLFGDQAYNAHTMAAALEALADN